jgi:hypothetical protein
MPAPTTRSSVRFSVRLTVVAVLACAAALTVAPAALGRTTAGRPRISNVKTFTLPAHTTRTFTVRYPSALKFAGADYSCRVRVLGLGARFVKILSRGSALGGTVCRVRARNTARLPSLDTTARIRVRATTILPPRISTVKSFTLPAHTTKTFTVRYPYALRFGGARYSCRARVVGLGKRFVRILSRGSALGGTVCRVRARNTAQLPSLDTTARIRVRATTSLPASVSNVRTFTLPAHTTSTFNVRFPFALRFSGAKYSCTATVLGLGARFVTILSRGSALGGTVCRVQARNNAQLPSLDTTAMVRVRATTSF